MESILWFLILGGAFYMMMKHGCGAHMGGHGARHPGGQHGDGSAQPDVPSLNVVDPVCGMKIKADHAHAMIRRGDRRLFFCSEECLSKFKATPQDYPPS